MYVENGLETRRIADIFRHNASAIADSRYADDICPGLARRVDDFLDRTSGRHKILNDKCLFPVDQAVISTLHDESPFTVLIRIYRKYFSAGHFFQMMRNPLRKNCGADRRSDDDVYAGILETFRHGAAKI